MVRGSIIQLFHFILDEWSIHLVYIECSIFLSFNGQIRYTFIHSYSMNWHFIWSISSDISFNRQVRYTFIHSFLMNYLFIYLSRYRVSHKKKEDTLWTETVISVPPIATDPSVEKLLIRNLTGTQSRFSILKHNIPVFFSINQLQTLKVVIPSFRNYYMSKK